MIGGKSRLTMSRLATALILVAAELAAATMLLVAAPAPAQAQFFDDRFPFQNRRQQHGLFDWFGPQSQPEEQRPAPPPVDYSKAPPPKKAETKVDATEQTSVMVIGDSMADWLAYGLELAYAESPEIGVLRRHRTNSGLIRTEVRNDPRGEYPDWPQAARELISTQKPKFVLMMIGVNDRRTFHETAQAAQAAQAARNAKAVQPAAEPAKDPATAELDQRSGAIDKPAGGTAIAAVEPPSPGGIRSYEFRTDAWSEAYIRRIDETIAALKTSGVPVFWVGLPPVRGAKSSADMSFLNDLYRSRADKAGIIYIDVWDGFVDEDGRYAQYGPDVEGQTRRLRAGDGVHFTQAGARKLAHYVERELQRWLSARTAALPAPEEPKTEVAARPRPGAAAAPGGPAGRQARPLAGPTVPLVGEPVSEPEELLGSNPLPPVTDALASKVLVKGDALPVPAGRADDFAWPRRDIAPVGSDPVVATTDLPMTPMVAERSALASASGNRAGSGTAVADATQPAAAPRRRAARPPAAVSDAQPSMYRPDYRPDYRRSPGFFNFPFLFGGGR